MFSRGEVLCIIKLDQDRSPFVSEVLLLERNTLSMDKLRLLYLERSKPILEEEEAILLGQIMQEIRRPDTLRRHWIAIEEETGNLEEIEKEVVSCFAKKYKPVALKVKPVLGTLPERFRIMREIVDDPLQGIPELPEHPPEFEPRGHYTLERKEKLDMAHKEGFLWPEERKLMYWLVREQNKAFAWDDTEREKFKEEYFPLVEIPTVAHILWVEKPFRIPPAIYEKVCKMIKKNSKSLRIVHSLEPLNRVTIAHSGLPQVTEELAIYFAGRACSGILDLYVGYDERVL